MNDLFSAVVRALTVKENVKSSKTNKTDEQIGSELWKLGCCCV